MDFEIDADEIITKDLAMKLKIKLNKYDYFYVPLIVYLF